MKHLLKAVTLFVAVLVASQVTMLGAENAPYADGMEYATVASLLSSDAWKTNDNGGTLSISQTSVEGSWSVYMSTNQLVFELGDADATNVWFYINVKPGLFVEDPPKSTVDGSAAAFCVNTNGDLRAYSNSVWVTVATDVPTNGWMALAAHLDYKAETWDLYYTSNAFDNSGHILAKVGGTLGFATNHTEDSKMTNIVIDTEIPGYIDYMAVMKGTAGEGVPTADDAYVCVIPVPAGESRTGMAKGYKYATANDGRTLAGALGADLGNAVVDGSNKGTVTIQGTNGQSWVTFGRESGYWVHKSGGPLASNAVDILPGTAVWIDTGDEDATARFIAYDSLQTSFPDVPLYGTDNSEWKGWNSIEWPLDAAGEDALRGTGVGATGDEAGALLYVERDGDSPLLLNFDGSNWRDKKKAYTNDFLKGQKFWYFRMDSEDGAYDVVAP
jgi:hypothetical protein